MIVTKLGDKFIVMSDDMTKTVFVKFDGDFKEKFGSDDIDNSKKIEWGGWCGNNVSPNFEPLSGIKHSKFKNVVRELKTIA